MTAQLLQLTTSPDLVDQVYRALLDAISEGSLAPGQRITQEELAERLAVSRQPVMQALRLLKKDGFVQDAPGRGLQVTLVEPQACFVTCPYGNLLLGGERNDLGGDLTDGFPTAVGQSLAHLVRRQLGIVRRVAGEVQERFGDAILAACECNVITLW